MIGRTESQASIAIWAANTFGYAAPLRIAVRAAEELVEAMRDLSVDDRDAAATEFADVAIILYRQASEMGFDLEDAAARIFTSPGDPGVDPMRCAAQANVQLAYVIREFAYGADPVFCVEEIARFLAGAYWWCARGCAACGRPLAEAVDAKMTINRQRVWLVTAGTGRHVRGEAVDA